MRRMVGGDWDPKFGQDAPRPVYRARGVRAKCRLAGLTMSARASISYQPTSQATSGNGGRGQGIWSGQSNPTIYHARMARRAQHLRTSGQQVG